MASLLPVAVQRTTSPTRANKIRELLLKGFTVGEIAEKLAKGNQRKKKSVRKEIRRIMAVDQEFAAMQMAEVNGSILIEAPEVTEAVVRRAKRGRVDAAKLLFEMSGIHNPKVKHEHSGELSIKISGLPRPKAVETEDSVVDADVVEEDLA